MEVDMVKAESTLAGGGRSRSPESERPSEHHLELLRRQLFFGFSSFFHRAHHGLRWRHVWRIWHHYCTYGRRTVYVAKPQRHETRTQLTKATDMLFNGEGEAFNVRRAPIPIDSLLAI